MKTATYLFYKTNYSENVNVYYIQLSNEWFLSYK